MRLAERQAPLGEVLDDVVDQRKVFHLVPRRSVRLTRFVPVLVQRPVAAPQTDGPPPSVLAARAAAARGERVPHGAAAAESRNGSVRTVARPGARRSGLPGAMRTPDPRERRVLVQAGSVDDDGRFTRATLQQPLRRRLRRRDGVHQYFTGASPRSISARCGSSQGGSFRSRPSDAGSLVDREPGLHRRDLEQHAAGLAEIDRLEVAAIAHLRHLAAVPQQLLAQPQLLVGAARPPSRRDAPCRGRSPPAPRRHGARRRSSCPGRRRSPPGGCGRPSRRPRCSRAAASSARWSSPRRERRA